MGRIGTEIRCFALRIGILALALTASTGFQQPTFKVQVRLVRLLVTVKDAAGQLIGSLDRSQFSVYDNGVRQQIAVFERHTEQPLSVAMLVDASGSTAIDLRYELESVHRFLNALVSEGNPNDAAALYSFNWAVTLESSFTRRMARLSQALKELKAEGGTSLYDAIYLASGDLSQRDGRHVLVIVTDGGDTTSSKSYQDALQAAHLADTVIYPILVMPITNDAGRNIGGENALTTLAAGTGGRVFAPSLGVSLDAAFADILRDLRTQYLIGYYPKSVPPTSNRFHTVRIELARKDLRAVTRTGYYGDSEEAATKGSR